MVDIIRTQCSRGRDSRKILSPLTGMWKDCLVSADPQYATYYFNDMFDYTEADWTITEDGSESGTSGQQDDVNGWIAIYCDGDDNDEVYFAQVGEAYKIADGKDIWFEAKIKLTEAATDDSNWIIGLSEGVGADHLQDNGAGPPATYDGIVFFKVDGTMTVQCESSLASTQVTDADVGTFTSGTAVRLGFHVRAQSSTIASCDFYVDGTIQAQNSITYSGHGEMQLFFGVKAGGTNEEALHVDYIKIVQLR